MAHDHLGMSFGERIFRAMGISPWTEKGDWGFNLPTILGLLLLITGIAGTERSYRHIYPKILSRLLIGCFVVILIFPFVTEKMMGLIKYNTSGTTSLDYDSKESHCTYYSQEMQVEARCTLVIYNYGKEQDIKVKPVLSSATEIQLEPVIFAIRPHQKNEVAVNFHGVQTVGIGGSGSFQGVGAEIEVDGKLTKYDVKR